MYNGKIIENKDLPQKNQWRLVKSNSNTAESDIESHSEVEKKTQKFEGSQKQEDKSTQVNEKSRGKDGNLDSSSNLSSNVSENKAQVKFKEGPDEVYDKDQTTVQTDHDTSDLLCDYVVLRDNCGPNCGQRTIESINNHYPHVGEHFEGNTDIYHYYPHQKSAKISEINQDQNACGPSNKTSGDAFQFFGNRQNNNQEISNNSQNMKHRLNERKVQNNSENAAPCRSIKRLKRIFGQEQHLTTASNKNPNQNNKQHLGRPSIRHKNMQSSGKERRLFDYSPMRFEPRQTGSYNKMTVQGNENISKYTIFDGFHTSKGINMDTLSPPEYNCKHFANGSGDMEFQSQPSFVLNGPSEINDDKGDINIRRNGYRISNPLPERIEVYYFDHGSSSYFRTTDHPPTLATDLMIEKTDQMSTKFWAGIFGFLHIFFAVLTSFYLQLFRFVLISSVRPLLIGTFQVSSDYFLKPFLATLFNALIQPFLILFYNVATSFRDLCEPMARGIGFFLEEIANILRSIRLVEVKNSTRNGPFLNPYRNQAIEI